MTLKRNKMRSLSNSKEKKSPTIMEIIKINISIAAARVQVIREIMIFPTQSCNLLKFRLQFLDSSRLTSSGTGLKIISPGLSLFYSKSGLF